MKHPFHWKTFFVWLFLIGFLLDFAAYYTLSGAGSRVSPPLKEAPRQTLIGIKSISLTPIAPTPFLPIPTDTPTSTATLPPTPTFTITPQPSNTPLPSNTPIPPPPQNLPQPTYDGIPPSASIPGIHGENQGHLLSCESRSAVDWAAYFGVAISEDHFQSLLPSSDDPDVGFVGNPDGAEGQLPPQSYGVHADPVAAVLRQLGLNAAAVHGYSYAALQQQIAAGHLVIVWVYGNVWYGVPSVSYTASDRHSTNVVSFEHTVIVTGYDENNVTVLDDGLFYTRSIPQFLSSWSTLKNMGIILQ